MRKPKTKKARLVPIITFEDYTKAITPLDRYRKHYMIFDYWNHALMDELRDRVVNSKRLKRASAEALAELEEMKGLVVDDVALRFEPILKERRKLDKEFRIRGASRSRTKRILYNLDAQTRKIHRELFWSHVEDKLKQNSSAP